MRKPLIALSTIATFLVLLSTVSAVNHKPLWRLADDFSLNWAGYYVSSSSYTSASATWIVPTVSTSTTGYSSAWVGIGGVSGTQYLIQTGTEQDCSSGSTSGERIHSPSVGLIDKPSSTGKGNGGGSSSCTPTYYAWWETYPANAEQKISGFNVSSGDVITASVQKINSTSWTISISSNKGYSFTKDVNFAPDQSTAEAIIERPALCLVVCQLTNLANFGTISFSSISANSVTFPNSATNITMVDNAGKILAKPGPISSGSFSVTWLRSN